METYQLQAQLRKDSGKGVARKLRAAGMVPAIAYGPKQEEPLALALNRHETVAVLNKPTGRVLPLEIKVGETIHKAVVRDVQVHPVTRTLLHLDLLLLDDETPVKVRIPVRRLGRSKGEALGARLVVTSREVLVSCLPSQIPEAIEHDVSTLGTGEVIYVDQIAYPEGVTPIYQTRYPVIVLKKIKAALEGEGEEGEGEEGAAEGEAAAEAPAE